MIKNLICIGICFLHNLIFSQIQNGIVQYKITSNSNFEDPRLAFIYTEEDKKITPEIVLELQFNQSQSCFGPTPLPKYKEEQKTNAFNMSRVNGFYFKNANSKTIDYYKNDSSFGPIVIEYDSKIEWVLTNETKKIAGYICYKATATLLDYNFMKYTNSEITAWYCPEIPVNLGPKRLSGLPGLILETTEREVTLSAYKIQLNSEKADICTIPFNAKRITHEGYKKLIDEYIEEMNRN